MKNKILNLDFILTQTVFMFDFVTIYTLLRKNPQIINFSKFINNNNDALNCNAHASH